MVVSSSFSLESHFPTHPLLALCEPVGGVEDAARWPGLSSWPGSVREALAPRLAPSRVPSPNGWKLGRSAQQACRASHHEASVSWAQLPVPSWEGREVGLEEGQGGESDVRPGLGVSGGP